MLQYHFQKMLMLSAEDVTQLRANATERQLILSRLAVLEQQDGNPDKSRPLI